jgi:formyl-CoA transferase
VVAAFDAAHAAAAPIYDMADVFADPQLAAREAIVEADGVPMQGMVARLSRTPGAVRWAGRPLGADDPPRWAPPADRAAAADRDGDVRSGSPDPAGNAGSGAAR